MSIVLALITPMVVEISGSLWEHNPDQIDCEKITWVKQPWEIVRVSCGFLACVKGCEIISGFSEEEAEYVRASGGESLKKHEYRHIEQKLRHPIGGKK